MNMLLQIHYLIFGQVPYQDCIHTTTGKLPGKLWKLVGTKYAVSRGKFGAR